MLFVADLEFLVSALTTWTCTHQARTQTFKKGGSKLLIKMATLVKGGGGGGGGVGKISSHRDSH